MRTCKNKPHPAELNKQARVYQDGWYDDFGGRIMAPGPNTQWKEDVACGHTERAEDPGCNGCKWQKPAARCGLCQGTGILRENQKMTGILMKSKCPNCSGKGK